MVKIYSISYLVNHWNFSSHNINPLHTLMTRVKARHFTASTDNLAQRLSIYTHTHTHIYFFFFSVSNLILIVCLMLISIWFIFHYFFWLGLLVLPFILFGLFIIGFSSWVEQFGFFSLAWQELDNFSG